MPHFIETATGRSVAEAIATDSAGHVRAGYRSVLSEGESVSFSPLMRDSAAGRHTVFLTDAADPHAWARQVRDAARDGTHVPRAPITRSYAEPSAVNDQGRAVRDLARASQY